MTAPSDLFPGFAAHRFAVPGCEIHARIGGTGPPLVLLHGYPQTHVCWHRIAPDLAQTRTLVILDLRGYGASSAPSGDAAHETYSKRAMGGDVRAVMRALGHDRFEVMGHDRGARVAYRLSLDHPEAVTRLLALDILPTAEVWARTSAESALKSYHWTFLAQPYPMPERLIGGAPLDYLDHTLKSWTRDRSLGCFDPRALAHYRALFDEPARIHAVCEDYRAGASLDRARDESDRAAGRRISCPTLVLWGSDYVGKGAARALDVWRAWCPDVVGEEIVSGHFLAEENPEATMAAIRRFLERG
jgi:haloacetate dehalogenase